MLQNIYSVVVLLCWLIIAPVSSTPLPYQASAKHLGVASCASSVCHGSIRPNDKYNIPLNEYVIWSQRDRHAKAYETLLSKESKAIATKLGLRNAHTARICLDCHADNVPKQQRGDGFQLTDGVGCETCHGGSENWIETHANKDVNHQDNVKQGMFPTADFMERANLCLSCHYGNDDKFASHQIMGAGHPRISFELDTFQALQPAHFQIDEEYKKRKPTASHTKIWALGQIVATKAQLHLLQGKLISQPLVFPELALFDCHACHNNSMHRLDWHRRMNTALGKPGNVPLADGHLRMAIVIADQLDKSDARKLAGLSQALQKASGENRQRIVNISRQLQNLVEKLSRDLAVTEFGYPEKERILVDLINMGIEGEFRDYIGAEQAVMAIELIIIDMDKKAQSREQLDDLYKLVKNDETYQPVKFMDALKKLKAVFN
ncbi:MAG: multiheme c-type cytochrome [Methylococcales bacterium]